MRYRPTTDVVLKGMNVKIKAGEKVGIVGRTGAGKSTLAISLTRIVDIFAGQITIDGVDINKISLQQVREAITIIPQDPVLFQGSIRYNLDPTNCCSDEEIRDLLKEAGLAELLLKKREEQKEKDEKEKSEKKETEEEAEKTKKAEQTEVKDELLEFAIEGSGGNLSSGEKALVCICRAVLRKSKVVILDEATATVDLKTEQSIQKLVDSRFKGSTMLVIAHRLQTIINSDKVLLIGDGRKREFGDPKKLMKDENSLFRKLVDRMQSAGK